MSKYSIGIDFGTLSGRAIVVDLSDGHIAGESVMEYPHKVMSETLPDGTPLGSDWALQHPRDYLEVLYTVVPQAVRESGVNPADIIGIGIDFTSSTVLPVRADGTPLCFEERFASEPHAYVKLWKHHAAQADADRLNEVAAERKEKFLTRYGGKTSSEWMIPKIMQILREAPEIYGEAAAFIEAADWIVLQLTGEWTVNACAAGFKCLWSKRDGYPSEDFFAALDPRLKNFVKDKIKGRVTPVGRRAGRLTQSAACRLGLAASTAVAAGVVDAHAALPAVGVVDKGKMLLIIGTSSCDVLLSDREEAIEGICGIVEDGVIEGYYAYESGQSCVGDLFDWFVNNCVPSRYEAEARCRGINIHALLSEKAAKLAPGESGLVALDWWNGNRSVLVDSELSGLIAGVTLGTKPEEIYRALIEATAFGKRVILDTYEAAGVKIDELYACGGISRKNELMMQIYADVTGREITVSACSQTSAMGAVMMGAVAAGKAAGGFDSLDQAAKLSRTDKVYRPIARNVGRYARIFVEYKRMHDFFGKKCDVMKKLRELKKESF